MLLGMGYKQLWAEAVNSFVHVKHCLVNSSMPDKTPFEAYHGYKPSIGHLQPFGHECYVHIPKSKRSGGSKMQPHAQRGIFVGYTRVDHHMIVFLPKKKRTIVSSDMFFLPPRPKGAVSNCKTSHLDEEPTIRESSRSTTELQYPIMQPTSSRRELLNWMDRNPQAALELHDQGHHEIHEVLKQAYQSGKRDGVLGSQYWDTSSENSC